MTLIHGFKSELLIGIETSEGAREGRLELRKSSAATEQAMTNEKFAANHPMQHMGRIISTLVDRIGDEEVFEPFRRSKYQKIPRAILKLPLRDLDIVYFLAHLHTHGPKIDMGSHDCPECRKKNTKVEIDLSIIELLKSRVDDVGAFSVLLDTGFIRIVDKQAIKTPDLVNPALLDYHNKYWNHYTFRAPTLEDAIRHEERYSPKNRINFNMRIYNDALLTVESWDKEGDDAFKVAELETRHREMEGMELFDTLDGCDRGLIRGLFMKLPGLDLKSTHECNFCGEDMEIHVDPTNFHPLASEG